MTNDKYRFVKTPAALLITINCEIWTQDTDNLRAYLICFNGYKTEMIVTDHNNIMMMLMMVMRDNVTTKFDRQCPGQISKFVNRF